MVHAPKQKENANLVKKQGTSGKTSSYIQYFPSDHKKVLEGNLK
jgi:hypothetical protein